MIIDASKMLSTVDQTKATTLGPQKITSSNSVTLAPIQNITDITTQETSLLSTTSLGPGKKNILFEIGLYIKKFKNTTDYSP